MNDSLHAYYAKQDVSVSFRNLKDEADLARHIAWREAFYTDKLGLPPAFFRGLHVGEFGPDTGENALAFAKWGAKLTLAEPHTAAHSAIKDYFRRFGLESQLAGLSDATLESFQTKTPFDFINAEGFVGSIRPPEKWLGAMNRLLAPDGLFLISYYERCGAWLEQAVNALAALLSKHAGMEQLQAAKLAMEAKWNKISHSRPFEAWYMDAIKNPFARQAYQFDSAQLLELAAVHGFRLHASTPIYRDPLWVGWYRHVMGQEEYLTRTMQFIRRSRMGHMLGHGCFWTGDLAALAPMEKAVKDLLNALDGTIDNPGSGKEIAQAIRAMAGMVIQPHWMTDTDLKEATKGLDDLAGAFEHAGKGRADEVARYGRENSWFLKTWGTPVHFAVFRREGKNT